MSIDDFFLGRFDDRIERRQVFADREQERHFLLQRISAIHALAPQNLLDFDRGATNLSVLVGQGGIGKSALLREIRSQFQQSPDDRKSRRAVAFIDFSDYTFHNFESVLVQIRASLAQIRGKWIAFDLGLANYWTRKHPGIPLTQFISNSGFLGEDQKTLLNDQISGSLDALLGGVGLVSSGYKLAGMIRRNIRESRVTARLRRDFPPFGVIIDEPDVDKTLGYLPILLSHDLEQNLNSRGANILFLYDTAEHIQGSRENQGSIEDFLSRLIYLTPNIAHVIATRVPLDWQSELGQARLTYGGLLRWPELKPTGGGQIHIGELDRTSADILLRDSLETQGQPAMPQLVRDRIIHASHGLPLHLELSISWYRDLAIRGTVPASDDIARTFPDLVFRIMRDLSTEERDLLRASSVYSAFSEDLLDATIPGIRASRIRSFVQRSFIAHTPNSWLPFSLHENLRKAVIEHDHLTEDPWTDDEWKVKARQSARWLEGQALMMWESDSAMSEAEIRKPVAAALLLSKAACQFAFTPERLGELAFTVTEFGYRKAFESMPVPDASTRGTPLGRLFAACHILAADKFDHRTFYRHLLDHMTFSTTSPCDQFIAVEFARAAEMEGDFPRAERAYRSLEGGAPQIAYYGVLGLAGNALRTGRLTTALSLIPAEAPRAFNRCTKFDLLGHIHLQGGHHEASANWFEQALDEARRTGSALWVARGMRHVAMASAWFDPVRALELLPQAREVNQDLEEWVGIAQCDLATAISWAWHGNWIESRKALDRCWSHNLHPVAVGHTGMIEVLLARASGDDAAMEEAIAGVFHASSQVASERPHAWIAISALWANRPDLADFDAVEWYDSAPKARARWLAVSDRLTEIWRNSLGAEEV